MEICCLSIVCSHSRWISSASMETRRGSQSAEWRAEGAMMAVSEATAAGNLQSQDAIASICNARPLSLSTRLPTATPKFPLVTRRYVF